MAEKVLITVDMQNDFIDGSLGTDEAQAIVQNVVDYIENSDADLFLYTLDTHAENYLETREGKFLPVEHCIKGSEGHKLNPEVAKALKSKNAEGIEKKTFGSKELVEYLKKRNAEYESFTLLGLCSDICVISNSLLLKAYWPEVPIRVVQNCVAGVSPESNAQAIAVMQTCQIEMV